MKLGKYDAERDRTKWNPQESNNYLQRIKLEVSNSPGKRNPLSAQ